MIGKSSVRELLLTLFLLMIVVESRAQSTVRVDSFYMPSLGRTKKITVILPAAYNPSRRYPVLYLLHGYGGDYTDWTKRTRLTSYINNIPLIIVMPDGENSWYVNSVTDYQDKFEDYVTRDIPWYIQKKYAVDSSRQGIAGLSMGGYGALMLALRHPSLYRFSGSLSGALTIPRVISDTSRQAERNLLPSLKKAFGERPSGFRNAHDVFYLYKKVSKDSIPYLYLAIGAYDIFKNFLPAHRALTDLLRTYGVAYEYHETQGGHTWEYWDREIQMLIQRMRDVLEF
ncbi:MAG: alpha/beta hydrolase family protein [bacterium]